jgi:5'-nucleotidase
VINGGIRADLPAGQINYGQLFEVQPFENGLVKLTLSGSRLRQALEHALDSRGTPTAHLAGAKVLYDPRRPAGKRVRRVELPDGRPLRSDAMYTLAVDDFVAAGGEGYTMLLGLPAIPAGMLDVNGLITYLRRLPQPVVAPPGAGFISTRP